MKRIGKVNSEIADWLQVQDANFPRLCRPPIYIFAGAPENRGIICYWSQEACKEAYARRGKRPWVGHTNWVFGGRLTFVKHIRCTMEEDPSIYRRDRKLTSYSSTEDRKRCRITAPELHFDESRNAADVNNTRKSTVNGKRA